ncbi:MAG: hypothetical protein ACK5PZ_06870, partial [Pirellula sp.]
HLLHASRFFIPRISHFNTLFDKASHNNDHNEVVLKFDGADTSKATPQRRHLRKALSDPSMGSKIKFRN